MSMVCLPVKRTMTIENAIMTANAAKAGADLVHNRRASAPGSSTDGRPRSRNHCSAAARCDASGEPMAAPKLGFPSYRRDMCSSLSWEYDVKRTVRCMGLAPSL